MTALPPELAELIQDEQLVAHLATAVDGKPHVAPLWYRYDDGIFEITTTGTKLENIRNNPQVALSLQVDENGMPAWMATIRGTATVVDDQGASEAGKHRIHNKYGADPDAFPENTLVTIDVEAVSYRIY